MEPAVDGQTQQHERGECWSMSDALQRQSLGSAGGGTTLPSIGALSEESSYYHIIHIAPAVSIVHASFPAVASVDRDNACSSFSFIQILQKCP